MIYPLRRTRQPLFLSCVKNRDMNHKKSFEINTLNTITFSGKFWIGQIIDIKQLFIDADTLSSDNILYAIKADDVQTYQSYNFINHGFSCAWRTSADFSWRFH